MKLKTISNELIGGTVLGDVILEDKEILIKDKTVLSYKHIDLLKRHNIKKIVVSPLKIKDELLFQLESFIPISSQPLFWEEYIHAIEETKRYFKVLESNQMESPEPILIKVHELINLLEDKKEFFSFAYTVRGSEDSLYRHTINVSILAYLIGNTKISLDSPILLSQMGFLHDIGKVHINQDILNKAAALTTDEMSHVQTHTTAGVELLKKLGITRKEIVDAVLLHHESRKGNGYPHKLKKEEIPFSVEIISTLDAFDAICSDRVYKEGYTFFQALNKLYFDTIEGILNPLISLPFIEEIYGFFLGSKVKLSNNQIGEIYYLNPKNIIRPIIQLENDTYLDLSQQDNLFVVDFSRK